MLNFKELFYTRNVFQNAAYMNFLDHREAQNVKIGSGHVVYFWLHQYPMFRIFL